MGDDADKTRLRALPQLKVTKQPEFQESTTTGSTPVSHGEQTKTADDGAKESTITGKTSVARKEQTKHDGDEVEKRLVELQAQIKKLTEKNEELAKNVYNLGKVPGPGDKRILFVTHKQASSIDGENIQDLLGKFELNNPKLVLRLLTSTNGSDSIKNLSKNLNEKTSQTPEQNQQMPLFTFGQREAKTDCENRVLPFLSFKTNIEGIEAERKLDIFTRKVLIPLCKKTRAVVICTPTRACSLGMSFGKAASFYAATHGGKLPFTVLAIDSTKKYTQNYTKEETTTFQFYNASAEWKERVKQNAEWKERVKQKLEKDQEEEKNLPQKLEKENIEKEFVGLLKSKVESKRHADGKAFQSNTDKPTNEKSKDQGEPNEADKCIQCPDLNPYIQNVIMVDHMDDDFKDTTKSLERLQFNILNHLMSSRKCLAIGTLRHENIDGWKDSASLVQTEVPVLYIDVRKRPNLEQFLAPSNPAEPFTPKDTAKALVESAKKYCADEWESLRANGRPDILDVCRMAFWHAIVKRAKGVVTNATSNSSAPADMVSICVAISDQVKLSESSNQQPVDIPDIVTGIINDQYRSYFEFIQKSEKTESYQTYFEDNIHEVRVYAHELFESPFFHSAHVEDIRQLEMLLNGIVMKDRLPTNEHLEGLMVLRSAWDVIDIGQINLRAYKYLSKFIYLFILASGIATVCLTVFTTDINSATPEIDSNMTPTGSIIFYLSVASTFITAFDAYVSPSGRWRQIRDTTCNLESFIWQYRTRTGPFKTKLHEDDTKATSVLKTMVSHAIETISTSDIGKSTSWSKKYSRSVFKHGQYNPLPKKKSIFSLLSWVKVSPEPIPLADDHHSPLRPDEYIQFRLNHVIEFYKSRLPSNVRARNLMSITLMMVTAAGTILAFRQYSNYVSICSTTAAAITSWMEYNNIVTKIGRYNGTATSLESLILWWSSITAVDRSDILNIDTLVQTGEQVGPFLLIISSLPPK